MINSEKEYICKCGKIFTSANSFNGHKRHCKEILGDEKYKLYKNNDLEKLKKATIASVIVKSKIKEERLKKSYNCERCGKLVEYKYGSGRFCSSQCAHSRKQTEETRNKISYSLTKEENKNKPKKVVKKRVNYERTKTSRY